MLRFYNLLTVFSTLFLSEHISSFLLFHHLPETPLIQQALRIFTNTFLGFMRGREGLEFKGLADALRALEYLDVLINYISKVELDPEVRKSLGFKFMELGRKLLEGVGSGGKG